MSEGEGLLGRKPSILTPDAPEFVPRWMQSGGAGDSPAGDAPATAPIIGEGPKANRSRSMGAGAFNHQLNHFPPHANPMAGKTKRRVLALSLIIMCTI